MWNSSYRTPTECWQKTSDLPKGKKLPTYLGRAKEKRKNRDKRIGMGPAPQGGSREGGKVPHTRKILHGQRLRGAEGGASEPRRRAQPQGCGGQSREIPAQRLGAEQHSPAREASLLTRRGGWGLGAEAPALVLAGRESGKKSAAAKEARDHCFRCARRGDSGHHLNELQRWARAMAISADTRAGHETLRLLPLPPGSLCASTGHYPHLPSWEPVQPATARVP